ncbi:ABC transporter permease [Halobacteria archaeon AArc-m2/3/4]|uniref:ABC transporter permease n=1 Tax=Natronoglomus mannanivorans TaxID=2979990 RepID=A0AAP3E3E4_9EURY|nr:ABC transporter permease [Halobacteria archaeon AArc-xg1-1]MCU4973795.1 ABC transporter permease [Halobacteria archaeon AArc-m2/3/4]
MVSTQYFIKRTAMAVVTFFVVISLTFAMIRLMPGGPLDYIQSQMAAAGQAPGEIAAEVERFSSINPQEPLWQQYLTYMANTLQGNLGESMWYNDPVAEILGNAMPWTIFVSIISMILIYLIGISMGAFMAYVEGSRFDVSWSTVSILLTSVPFYVIAVVLLWYLGYNLEWFPTSGHYGRGVEEGFNWEFISSVMHHGALPIASLTLAGFGATALAMRGNAIQILGEDYLRVARLRALSQRRIALRYVARNAVLPMYTSMMISLGSLFGSSIILEQIFQYPGVGYFMYRAISARDYPLMMGTFLFITAGVIIGVYIADLTYGYVDPRAGSGDREAF